VIGDVGRIWLLLGLSSSIFGLYSNSLLKGSVKGGVFSASVKGGVFSASVDPILALQNSTVL
jgi:hypothetical protein